MTGKRVVAVYFSAVGNTKRVTEAIATEVASALSLSFETVDFTLPAARKTLREFSQEDLVVFGVPTYAGRVPNKVLPFVESLFAGQGTPVMPVVTFGNRSCDSALTELAQVLTGRGFVVMGGGAFACEHVFSEKIGGGRPDAADWGEIHRFAGHIVDKVRGGGGGCGWLPVEMDQTVGPYYTPLGLDGQPAKFLKAKPVTDEAKCTACGICAASCPMGSVDPNEVGQVTGICIKCQACVRKCPRGAKHFADEAFLSHVAMLEGTYVDRAENHTFI